MSIVMDKNLNKVYDYITSFMENNGYAPTIREIMTALDIKSTSSVHLYLKKLDSKGLINQENNKSRAIDLPQKINISPDSLSLIPLIGRIPAGTPAEAIENLDYDSMYLISKELFASSQNLFMLKVVGSSMIEAGIFDGDMIIVKSQPTAINGQIVAAMIDDCTTVKRFYKENDCIRLKPENSMMSDIISRNVQILGIVIGLIRIKI